MTRTNIDLDNRLIARAQRLTGLKTKKEIVHRALEALVRTEDRKGILRFYGSGIWKGDPKAMRLDRARPSVKARGKPRDGAERNGP